VFVDVDPKTWCIDPRLLEGAVTPKTRGIIAVHLYGHPADMDAINAMAAIHGLWVVEDAAEAHLARYKDRPVGGLARIGTFSFYGNKVLSSGEGGAVVTSDPQLAVRMRTLRGQGVDPARRYFFPVIGYNFRMTNVAAAILCAQLERAQEMIAERTRVIDRYALRLRGRVTMQPRAPWATVSPWLFCALVESQRHRDRMIDRLAAAGIETRPFFVPLHTLPPYRACRHGSRLTATEIFARDGISLPTYPRLTNEDVDFISEAFLDQNVSVVHAAGAM
jgi:perosamine synthetase